MFLAQCGNRMLRHEPKLMKALIRAVKSGYLENPLTSAVWLCLGRMFSSFVTSGGANFIVFGMCQYGTSWRKPTKLLVFGPRAHQISLNRCNMEHGCCSRAQKPHQQLSSSTDCSFGILGNKTWRTSLAQVYPRKKYRLFAYSTHVLNCGFECVRLLFFTL